MAFESAVDVEKGLSEYLLVLPLLKETVMATSYSSRFLEIKDFYARNAGVHGSIPFKETLEMDVQAPVLSMKQHNSRLRILLFVEAQKEISPLVGNEDVHSSAKGSIGPMETTCYALGASIL